MSKRSLVMFLAILLFVAVGVACGEGDDDDGDLVQIRRLEFEVADLAVRFDGSVVPPVPHTYPDLVARVNGEDVTGDALMERQVALDQKQQEFATSAEQAALTAEELAPLLVQFEEADPLELLIEEALLRQAVAREGTLPSYEEAEESVRLNEAGFMEGIADAEIEVRLTLEEMIRQLGYPESDWPSAERIVEYLRGQVGLTSLRKQECEEPPESPFDRDPVRNGRDCTAFLASERAAADIIYFVRWAG